MYVTLSISILCIGFFIVACCIYRHYKKQKKEEEYISDLIVIIAENIQEQTRQRSGLTTD